MKNTLFKKSETFTLKDCRSNINNNITNNVKHIRKFKKIIKNYPTTKHNNFGYVCTVSRGNQALADHIHLKETAAILIITV